MALTTAWPYPRWIAHRGAGKLAPENTLAAFRLGASHGYRAFECDVKLSADGVPFLLHDTTLERTTSGQGTASQLTWGELSRLDAGGWPMKVEALEMLGAERLVYGKLGESLFTVRLDATLPPPKAGDSVSVQVQPQHLHWYDAHTKQRI